jgi:hypothetical protein
MIKTDYYKINTWLVEGVVIAPPSIYWNRFFYAADDLQKRCFHDRIEMGVEAKP